MAESASRLGLTVREIPATVEVIDQQTIRDRGLRTTTDVAQGAVGVTAGDNPAEPSAFSMRGFTNSQINTLYNGIKIGPPNMTWRVMDTANLERVEILKGPGLAAVGRRRDRRRDQLRDQGAAHRPDRERGRSRRTIRFKAFAPVMVPAAAPLIKGWIIVSTSAVRRSTASSTTPTPSSSTSPAS